MLRIYRAPSGLTYQFEEGTQPAGYEPIKPAKAQPKAKAPAANKARAPRNK